MISSLAIALVLSSWRNKECKPCGHSLWAVASTFGVKACSSNFGSKVGSNAKQLVIQISKNVSLNLFASSPSHSVAARTVHSFRFAETDEKKRRHRRPNRAFVGFSSLVLRSTPRRRCEWLGPKVGGAEARKLVEVTTLKCSREMLY